MWGGEGGWREEATIDGLNYERQERCVDVCGGGRGEPAWLYITRGRRGVWMCVVGEEMNLHGYTYERQERGVDVCEGGGGEAERR